MFDAWLRFARNVSVDGCRGSFGRFQKGGWHFLGVLFDARQSAREKELKQLEDQLVKPKAAQSKRTAQKERIVKDRVQQLINNVEGIGWGGRQSVRRVVSISGGANECRGAIAAATASLRTGPGSSESCSNWSY